MEWNASRSRGKPASMLASKSQPRTGVLVYGGSTASGFESWLLWASVSPFLAVPRSQSVGKIQWLSTGEVLRAVSGIAVRGRGLGCGLCV